MGMTFNNDRRDANTVEACRILRQLATALGSSPYVEHESIARVLGRALDLLGDNRAQSGYASKHFGVKG
jgi:hypothetical protein